MTAPFISTDDLGTYVGQDLSASELAIIVCDAACQLVRDEIDQFLNFVVDDVVVLDGTDRPFLIPTELPIVEITEITIDGGDPLTEGVDFRVVNERTMLQRLSNGSPSDTTVWSRGTAATVTYSHGWAVEEADVDPESGIFRMPSSIRVIALAVAAGGLVAGRTGVGGVKSETLGRYRYDLFDTSTAGSGMVLTSEQCDTLYKYRVEDVA